MHIIEKALQIALKAHTGQVDKAGKPYILHPLRLMDKVEDENEKLAALLHDVVEDSELTIDDLRNEGIPEEALTVIDLLTKRESEKYQDFIDRISQNPIAIRVKMADIQDNMDLSRLSEVKEKDLKRNEKYQQALNQLKNALEI